MNLWDGTDPDVDSTDFEPRCKFCGSTDVRWRQQGGQWVMFELQPGVVHDCRRRLRRMQASESAPTKD